MKKIIKMAAFSVLLTEVNPADLLMGSVPVAAPEPIRSIVLGEKIDFWGKNFDFYLHEGAIHVAYLDLIRRNYIEGRVSIEEFAWSVTQDRKREIVWDHLRGANSFLFFENVSGRPGVLIYTIGQLFYWSHRYNRWTDLPVPERGLIVQPIVRQGRDNAGLAFFWTLDRSDPSRWQYYKMDFREEALKELGQGDYRWGLIAELERGELLGKTADYRYQRAAREGIGSRWTFYQFEAEKGSVGESIFDTLLLEGRVHHLRFIPVTSEPTVLFGDRRRLIGVRLIDNEWVGRQLDCPEEYWSQEATRRRSGFMAYTPEFGNIEIVRVNDGIYVIYVLDGGVFLQVWDNDMEEFTEYWMGYFAEGSGKSISGVVARDGRLFTLSKDSPRVMQIIATDGERLDEVIDEAYIVDLTLREWRVEDLPEVRKARFEDLTRVEGIMTEDRYR